MFKLAISNTRKVHQSVMISICCSICYIQLTPWPFMGDRPICLYRCI